MSARLILFCFSACVAVLLHAEADVPYRDLSESGAGFYGPGREVAPPSDLATVRLGLFGPEKGRAGELIRAGAELAIGEANARGGFCGVDYELVFRADDGPWGMGAKQVVQAVTNGTGRKILIGLAITVAGIALGFMVNRGLAVEREVEAASTVNERQDRELDGIRESMKQWKTDLGDRMDRFEAVQQERHREVLQEIRELRKR